MTTAAERPFGAFVAEALAARRRESCRAHALARAAERGLALGPADLNRIEATIEKLRPLLPAPVQGRHLITFRRGRLRIFAVYDDALRCLITVWARKGAPPLAGEAA